MREGAKRIVEFRSQPPTPERTDEFEQELARLLREMGRVIMEWVLNRIEPEGLSEAAREVQYQGEWFRRRRKTPRRVGTLFGRIELSRRLYEPLDDAEHAIHPLGLQLGLVAGVATPALAEKVGWLSADGTQSAVRETLRSEHGVDFSCSALRKIQAALSAGMSPHRHEAQVGQVLKWLKQAADSRGKHRPVLAVGRDGIHLPMRGGGYREGATGTVSVYDRKGRRLGTLYLGRMPESGQTTLSEQLTALLDDVLARWDGPLPRLAYVTDAGSHPSDYFGRVLKPMCHPRTGRPLEWQWIVDFYHACQYITQLSEALFGTTKQASRWARRMRHWLKTKPNGIRRLLHSAAAHRSLASLTRTRQEAYDKAYNYLKRHRHAMQYAVYRRQGLPIGSGVTEAACKTLFTQRLKQSGMGWTIEGGQVIVDLRVIRLSGLWSDVFASYLQSQPQPEIKTPANTQPPTKRNSQRRTLQKAA